VLKPEKFLVDLTAISGYSLTPNESGQAGADVAFK